MDPGPTRNLPAEAQGFWRFDDCNMNRTELFDSSFFGNHTAFRSVTAFCRPGVLNTGVGFDEDDDLVIVPDQPNFVFSEGFTVAAWVKPVALGGVRTIFRKRQEGTSTFVLVENGKNFQIVISLANGKAADVQATATLDKFTHVAATYDGIFLKLYLDGTEAASKRVVGRLSDGVGPLLMGNDANLRRIDGIIDNVVFDTLPATPADIAKLTCLPRPSVMNVTPVDPAAVPPGTPVSYDVQITNNSCEDATFNFNAFTPSFNPDIIREPELRERVRSGGQHRAPRVRRERLSGHRAVRNVADHRERPAVRVQLRVVRPDRELLGPRQLDGVHGQAPAGARDPRRQRRRRSVSAPARAARGRSASSWRTWHRRRPTRPRWSRRCSRRSSASRRSTPSRSPRAPASSGFWTAMRGPNGQLDLSQPAFRLLAIVNRIDLNDVSASTAGEGRFVFGFAPFGQTLQATLILEYNIPATSQAEIVDLANAWHALRALPFPSEEYNAALQAVTERFTARNAAPGRPNGSALGQIRTNDFFALVVRVGVP